MSAHDFKKLCLPRPTDCDSCQLHHLRLRNKEEYLKCWVRGREGAGERCLYTQKADEGKSQYDSQCHRSASSRRLHLVYSVAGAFHCHHIVTASASTAPRTAHQSTERDFQPTKIRSQLLMILDFDISEVEPLSISTGFFHVLFRTFHQPTPPLSTEIFFLHRISNRSIHKRSNPSTSQWRKVTGTDLLQVSSYPPFTHFPASRRLLSYYTELSPLFNYRITNTQPDSAAAVLLGQGGNRIHGVVVPGKSTYFLTSVPEAHADSC